MAPTRQCITAFRHFATGGPVAVASLAHLVPIPVRICRVVAFDSCVEHRLPGFSHGRHGAGLYARNWLTGEANGFTYAGHFA